MAIKTVLCVAVTVSAAGALSITRKADEQRKADVAVKWSMETDLPRSVLHTNDTVNSGCGEILPGYFIIESLLWEDSWPAKAYNINECSQSCDKKGDDCVGFSYRIPSHSKKKQCYLYKGLHKKLKRGMSFVRCLPGFECQKGLPGFKFSHVGTWKDGHHIKELDEQSVEDCASQCHRKRGCVGLTYWVGHNQDKYCFHFENENNMEGPRRDQRGFSYAKCTTEPVQTHTVLEDGARFLQALASKKDEPKDEPKDDAPTAEEAKPEEEEKDDGLQEASLAEANPAAPAAEEAEPDN
jgi:hypothetical protein